MEAHPSQMRTRRRALGGPNSQCARTLNAACNSLLLLTAEFLFLLTTALLTAAAVLAASLLTASLLTAARG
jgi:hypothetical protein